MTRTHQLLLALCAASCTAPAPQTEGYVLIQPGAFTMGASAEDRFAEADERPSRRVELTRAFYLKSTEVTQGEWAKLMGANTANLRACGPTCPMNNVTRVQALDYLDALSRSENLEPCYEDGELTSLDCGGYRFPTEAEWEYAARAGTTEMTYAGTLTSSTCAPDPVLDRIAWYCGNAEVKYRGCWDTTGHGGFRCSGIEPVAQKEANAFGLYDMLGNVFEWTNDRYRADAYANAASRDPLGPSEGATRVIRGGGWFYFAWTVRVTRRYPMRDDDPLHPNVGLRPARTAR